MINRDRLLALSDAIIAVAATIMVLQLVIPDQLSMAVVRDQWPTLVAYLISYFQIFLAWHEHHDAFANAPKIDHRLFLLNTVWLLFITLLPFATGMVGRSPHHQPTVLFYIFILMMQSILLVLECKMIVKINKRDINDAGIISNLRKITFAGYGLAIIASFIEPIASIVIVIAACFICVLKVIVYDTRKHQLDNWE